MKKIEKKEIVRQAEKLYYEQNKTASEIAVIFQVNRTTVQRWLKSNNPEEYDKFTSASQKKNKRKHYSEAERKDLAQIWLKLFSEGRKLKDIAKEYDCSVSYISILMKKYVAKEIAELKAIKTEKAKEKKLLNKVKIEEEKRVDAWLKYQQAINAIEMSHGRSLSTYSMFMMHIHLFTQKKTNVFELKKELRHQMPYSMPKKYIYNIA